MSQLSQQRKGLRIITNSKQEQEIYINFDFENEIRIFTLCDHIHCFFGRCS